MTLMRQNTESTTDIGRDLETEDETVMYEY